MKITIIICILVLLYFILRGPKRRNKIKKTPLEKALQEHKEFWEPIITGAPWPKGMGTNTKQYKVPAV